MSSVSLSDRLFVKNYFNGKGYNLGSLDSPIVEVAAKCKQAISCIQEEFEKYKTGNPIVYENEEKSDLSPAEILASKQDLTSAASSPGATAGIVIAAIVVLIGCGYLFKRYVYDPKKRYRDSFYDNYTAQV